jgi:small-conductance mechanosensitive channel
MIRLHIPVGVSYDADPELVKDILLEAARQNGDVVVSERSEVFFTEFGDNSLNFNLLIWFNLSKIGKRRIRSRLYFTIFKELKKAGIEIPFPQRDLHLRSMVEPIK